MAWHLAEGRLEQTVGVVYGLWALVVPDAPGSGMVLRNTNMKSCVGQNTDSPNWKPVSGAASLGGAVPWGSGQGVSHLTSSPSCGPWANPVRAHWDHAPWVVPQAAPDGGACAVPPPYRG